MKSKIVVCGVFLLAAGVLLIASCTQEPPEVSADQVSVEKAAINDVVAQFHKAMAMERWADFAALLTGDCIIYGTDITDVDQGFAQLEPHMGQAFALLEGSNIHGIKDQTFVIDRQFASTMYDATWDVNFAGQQVSMPVRIALTFKKAGTWKIAQCLFSIPTVGESNEVLLEQMKQQ